MQFFFFFSFFFPRIPFLIASRYGPIEYFVTNSNILSRLNISFFLKSNYNNKSFSLDLISFGKFSTCVLCLVQYIYSHPSNTKQVSIVEEIKLFVYKFPPCLYPCNLPLLCSMRRGVANVSTCLQYLVVLPDAVNPCERYGNG